MQQAKQLHGLFSGSIRSLKAYFFIVFTALLSFSPQPLSGQVKLWGTGYSGGEGVGGIISLNPDGLNFESHPLPFVLGANPQGDLLHASNGKYYGMTFYGGNPGPGLIFEYDPSGGGHYKVLHNFSFSIGTHPFGSLIELGGKLYGMTAFGGSLGNGVIFEYNLLEAKYSILHEFDTPGGINPYGSLIEFGGNFYGMTFYGGSFGYGTIFMYSPSEDKYSVLHHFDNNNGSHPFGKLLESGGKFYGMTHSGNSLNTGVLFEYDPAAANKYKVMHYFEAASGSNPRGSLIKSNGKFYGMTYAGGSTGAGVVFQYNPNGDAYTVLHDFQSATGSEPSGSLLEAGGKFYGMTFSGGNANKGVIFEYNPSAAGGYSVLQHFNGTDGGTPKGSLCVSENKFFGMTNAGGSAGKGVIFEYNLAEANYHKLLDFEATFKSAYPVGNLLESNGKFYGMTNGGNSNTGAIFEYNPAGEGAYNLLHKFDNTQGITPLGSLLASGGKFYGMTYSGGSSDAGTLFEYDPSGAGAFSVLHHFNNAHGGYPAGTLLESGGKFYGSTNSGGDSNVGVLFEYDPSDGGTYRVLHHFEYTHGGYPQGALLEWNGKFYGMTSAGGNSDVGVIFEYDPSGAGMYRVLHHFDFTNGARPRGSLIEWEGKFYGMTSGGNSLNHGVIFKFDPSGGGTYSLLYTFNSAKGFAPLGTLLSLGGNLYGTTSRGGNASKGVIFKYNLSSGIYTVIKHLQVLDVNTPSYGSLIAVNCILPSFSACPVNQSVNASSSACTQILNYSAIAAGTPAPTITYEFSGATTGTGNGTGSGSAFNIGKTAVRITASSDCSFAATCSFTVTVVESEQPSITCPANKIIPAPLTCMALLGSQAPDSAFGLCSGGGVDITQIPAASTLLSGHDASQTVTLVATASNGNTATCAFTVTMQDQRKPAITCPTAKTINAGANCKANLGSWSPIAVSDHCSANLELSQNPSPTNELAGHNSAQTVMLTATDAAGNTRSCTFTVTLRDKSAPSLICPPNQTVHGGLACQAELGSYPPTVLTDNCTTNPSVTQVPGPTTWISGNGSVKTVTLSTVDEAGNGQSCTFSVTLSCPSPEPAQGDLNTRDAQRRSPNRLVLNVFPNPNEGVFLVEAQQTSAPDAVYEFVLRDVLGKQTVRQEGGAQQTFRLGDLPNGVYTLEARNGGERTFVRVVLQR